MDRGQGPIRKRDSPRVALNPGKFEPFSSEDHSLLEFMKQLCLQLNQPKWIPLRGFWAQNVRWDQFWLSHGDLLLPLTLKGRLTPEEWRPFLASHLIFRAKAKNLGYLLQPTLWAIPILLIGIAVSALTFNVASDVLRLLTPLPFVIAVAVVAATRIAGRLERSALESDVEASRTVGRESLIDAFRKIDGLGLKDSEKLKGHGWTARYSGRPSTTKRIRNLIEAS